MEWEWRWQMEMLMDHASTHLYVSTTCSCRSASWAGIDTPEKSATYHHTHIFLCMNHKTLYAYLCFLQIVMYVRIWADWSGTDAHVSVTYVYFCSAGSTHFFFHLPFIPWPVLASSFFSASASLPHTWISSVYLQLWAGRLEYWKAVHFATPKIDPFTGDTQRE
jgi:hypothetical protein